jgi:hypothetical protein
MEVQTKESFESMEEIHNLNKFTISMDTKKTLFCVVDHQTHSVSIFKDFQILFSFDEFSQSKRKIFTSFSPNGDFLILQCQLNEIIIIEIETQIKTKIEKSFKFSSVYFIPYKNFMIIKSWGYLSTTEEIKKSGEIQCSTNDKLVTKLLFDFPRKMIYLFISESPILSCFANYSFTKGSCTISRYNMETLEQIDIKENSGVPKFLKGLFLMKSGDLLVYDSDIQLLMDKQCKILKEIPSSKYFKNSKFIEVLESKNFIISMLENDFIAIQDPYTLSPLGFYKEKYQFQSLLQLEKNPKKCCILAGDSNKLIPWKFHNQEIFKLFKKSKLFDLQFDFLNLKTKKLELIVGIENGIESQLLQRRKMKENVNFQNQSKKFNASGATDTLEYSDIFLVSFMFVFLLSVMVYFFVKVNWRLSLRFLK